MLRLMIPYRYTSTRSFRSRRREEISHESAKCTIFKVTRTDTRSRDANQIRLVHMYARTETNSIQSQLFNYLREYRPRIACQWTQISRLTHALRKLNDTSQNGRLITRDLLHARYYGIIQSNWNYTLVFTALFKNRPLIALDTFPT